MTDAITVAIITGLVNLFVGSMGVLLSNSIAELEKKVDKHNNLIDRMYKCESLQDVQCEQIKVANHRIEDLERAQERL